MLFIFRKLRRSFFLPGKVRTYVAYAIGETMLIVVGIMLALQISKWNQARVDKSTEQFYLNQLLVELQSNRPDLQNELTVFKAKPVIIERLLEELKMENNEESFNAAFKDYINKGTIPTYFWPKTSTFDELKSNGKLEIIQDRELRNKVVSFFNGYGTLFRAVDLNQDYVTPMDRDLGYDLGVAKLMDLQQPAFAEYSSAADIYKFKLLEETLVNHAANHYWTAVDLLPIYEKQLATMDELMALIQAELAP